ncbi:MAG: hypothetical protein COA69_11970 [Robiginitomaculum sp.]|nr:MAG: hypothetical protein COA69_11970 [Robiginitomaculum sp.]
MKFGLPISFALHALVVSGGVFLWSNGIKDIADVKIIPLEIVTVADTTNVMPTRKKRPQDRENSIDVQTPEQQASAEPVPPAPVAKAVKKPEPEKKPEKIEPKQVEPVAVKKSAPKQPAFNLDAFATMINKSRAENPDANVEQILIAEAELAKQNQNGAGAGSELTVSPEEYIKAKMEPCWLIDQGARDYQLLRVEIALSLNERGEISTLNILNGAQIIASPNNAWRAARENVVAALNECAPYDGLRTSDYNIWKTMKLNFQPGDT